MVLIGGKMKSYRLKGTCFEDLSNELMYDIFDFLDAGHTIEAFSGLNSRFQRLFTRSSLPLKIDFSLISKSTFRYRSEHIIRPYIHRIISLRFPNQMSVNLFTSLLSFNSFLHLQSLIFHRMITKNLIPILTDLISLPQLFSLTITITDQSDDDKLVCQLIFRLPVLKYCKISFGNSRKEIPLSITDNQALQNSTIEYLIINGFYNINGLTPIIANMKKLRHLSCNSLWASNNIKHEKNIIPSSLKYLSLKLDEVSFGKFKSMISQFNFQLEVLRITALFDKKYLDAHRWKRIISNHMPQLRVFDFECHCNTSDDNVYHNLIQKFNSSFWLERNWFFGHRHGQLYNKTYAYVYSIKPYRKTHHFYMTPEKNETCTYRDTGINLARCVSINIEAVPTKCSIEFPCITELDLVADNIKYDPMIISKLSSSIPLMQLTHLCIGHGLFPTALILELLDRAINVRTLILHNVKMLDRQTLSSNQIETLYRIFNKNKIRKVTIDAQCTLRHYQFLMNLCPQLKYLKMAFTKKIESIVRFLLFQSIHTTSQLSILCISHTDKILFKQIQTMVDREKLLDDYSIELIDNDLYLWW